MKSIARKLILITFVFVYFSDVKGQEIAFRKNGKLILKPISYKKWLPVKHKYVPPFAVAYSYALNYTVRRSAGTLGLQF